MRWLIGVTLAWFVFINLANLNEVWKHPFSYNKGTALAAGMGLAASVIGLAGIIFWWGI